MSATVLFELKKKRRAPSTKKSPFPLVFNLGCDDKSSIVTWQFYRGTLRPDGVEVAAKEDMKNLYNMGYFGKGSLSRSAPRFKAATADVEEAPEMSQRRFERHKHMQEQASLDTKEAQNNAKPPRFVLLRRDEATDEVNPQRTPNLDSQVEDCEASPVEQTEGSDQDITQIFEGTVSKVEDEASTSQTKPLRHRKRGKRSRCRKSNSDEDVIEVFSKTKLERQQEQADMNPQEDPVSCGNGKEEVADSVEDEVMEDVADSVPSTHPCGAEVEVRAGSDDDITELPSEAALDSREDDDTGILQIDLEGNGEEMGKNDVEEADQRPKGNDRGSSLNKVNDIEVIPSDSGPRLERDHRLFSAEDPCPVDESLQLFFEEAYFLSYGLGCLIVQENNEELDLLKLWQRLCALCPTFPARYAAYHHFRSKGWVVRTGSRYAADYLLYKDGPAFYHATFSVLVRQAWSETLEETADCRLRSWTSLAGLIRLNASAAKAVLLCYVVIPKDVDLSTPECLRSFKIQELLLRRWITSEERERKDDG
uniref:tRNA-intron lyase n=1 Tax=Ixodes ricinus TaxID=34613 RepID=A0A131XWF7_IXORI